MTAVRRSVVVHGHFYQPPRENPWTGRVPVEPSAAPFHDWNIRVHDECYAPVTAARVLDGAGRVAAVVNTLEWISWDAGPTLLSWLSRETPDTYRAFLDADARSAARLGHGNALAAPYHHVILPLASHRDKVTEVRWGIADFRRRFGREPEGMWLPEAAVDTETLEVLAAEGIRFTVLGPTQVVEAPEYGLPGRVRLPSGAHIAVFVYDGGLSHDVAFGALLPDAHKWATRMADGDGAARRLTSLATDGETFGHHHRWGDMALAAAVLAVRERDDVRLENYASFLARHPAQADVVVVEPSAWSCAHGVDRWRTECGCKADPSKPTQQRWRRVLREGLDELATALHGRFEREAGALVADPWAARDAYGSVLDHGDAARRRFVVERADRPLTADEVERALALLEMERDALRMFTSCGWFFDDLAGLEPLQVLRYAAHALDLLGGDAAAALEENLVRQLAEAESNDPTAGNGARLWNTDVRHPSTVEAAPSPSTLPSIMSVGGLSAAPAPDLRAAVHRFLREPVGERGDVVVRRAADLVDAGVPVPFDIQTTFGRALPGLRATAPMATREVARALGFSEYASESTPTRAGAPVGYVFGIHVHQPVGNFDDVFRSHAEDVYLPLLERLSERNALPLALHVSGPLLSWLEAHGHPLLDLIGQMATDGRVELMLSGFYEPVLPVLARQDRLDQIAWMKEWLRTRFGVNATGLWLTERVWEPGLPEDLAGAGVRYAMVDDRHFLVNGHERRGLHRPWRTESAGKSVALFPIDEHLRYLVPFRPPEEFAAYMRTLQADGRPLAVLADDGEKFGGWPGTADWVWRQGWLDHYLDTLDTLQEQDVIRLITPSQALERVPAGGLTYLPTASYHEMEKWSLPPAAAHRLDRLEHLVAATSDDPDASTLLRGGHWPNFLTRYVESNRMHKKAAALSVLCRERRDPAPARHAIGSAQCNDAYWHGVFGGLYLRHLRAAIWAKLAEAEGLLRAGEPLRAETLDLYEDGRKEVWVHASTFSAVVAPSRGGAIEELTVFARQINLADVLTRRRESYHESHPEIRAKEPRVAPTPTQAGDPLGMPSIHHIEAGLMFGALPPFDREERALLVDRVVPAGLDPVAYERADYDALTTWASVPLTYDVDTPGDGTVTVRMRSEVPSPFEKAITFEESGRVRVAYRWDPAAFPEGARFAPELSVAVEAESGLDLDCDPPAAAVWRYEIRTVSKSESGSEESVQGVALTPLWPASAGEARLSFRWS